MIKYYYDGKLIRSSASDRIYAYAWIAPSGKAYSLSASKERLIKERERSIKEWSESLERSIKDGSKEEYVNYISEGLARMRESKIVEVERR